MNFIFCFASSGTSTRSFSFSFGMITVVIPARIATSRRVSQACNHTGFAGLELCFANVFCRAKHFSHELRRDAYVLGLSARNARRNAPTNRRDLTLQFAHTSFMRVIVDDVADGFLLPLALLGFKSIFF